MDTKEQFEFYMNGILGHSKAGSTHTYPIPIQLLHISEELSPEAKLAIKNAAEYAENYILSFLDKQKKDVLAVVDSVTEPGGILLADASMSSAQFVAKMNALKVKAQKEAAQNIDAAYTPLIQAGLKHPEARPVIVHKTQAIVSSNQLIIQNLINSYNSLSAAGGWIENAAKSVAGWFSGAASSIGHAFSGIF